VSVVWLGMDMTGQLAMELAAATAAVLRYTGAFIKAEKLGKRPVGTCRARPESLGRNSSKPRFVAGLAGSGRGRTTAGRHSQLLRSPS